MEEYRTEPKFRTYNRCNYDIGIRLENNREVNIKPGSFALLTAADIEYVDSICQDKKFIATRMLVPVDVNGNELDLANMCGIVMNEAEEVLTEDVITAALKKSAKQVQAWIDGIDDPAELHAIYKVAVTMDLPASKLKILNAKMPNKDWLDEMN